MSETAAAFNHATRTVTPELLPRMVLAQRDLPSDLHEFLPARDDILDNVTMAQQSFPGSSAERFRTCGRLTGYMQEFVAPALSEEGDVPIGYDLAAATVVHLFVTPDDVSRWITEVFIGDFEAHVGQEIHDEQRILTVERLSMHGFADEAAGLRVVQSSPHGPISSTVVDFRIGRVLGVSYVATLGNCERQELVQRLGLAHERRIVEMVFQVL